MKKEQTEILPQDEEVIKTVKAIIRPLPENVIPSQRFMRQMRLRLLGLESRSAAERAA